MRGNAAWIQRAYAIPPDSERFYIDFLPFERRLIRRDGVQMFRIFYWDSALSVLAGRSDQKFLVRYDPRDLSKVFVKDTGGKGYRTIPYRDLNHPPITLMEQRAALRELAKSRQQAITESTMFNTIAGQRALIERARHKSLTARRKAQQKPGASSRTRSTQMPQSRPDEAELSTLPVEPYAVETWDE